MIENLFWFLQFSAIKWSRNNFCSSRVRDAQPTGRVTDLQGASREGIVFPDNTVAATPAC